MKNLKINNFKADKLKLIKNGLSIMSCACILLSSSGCNNVSTNDYYIVSANKNYYLCSRKYYSVNCKDYSYDSIVDGKNVGLTCIGGKNFDYETHHVSTNFLSDFQVVNLGEAINNKKLSEKKLMELASSKMLSDIADNYFVTKEFPITVRLDNNEESRVKMFIVGEKNMIGYDVSPSRISNSMKYIYSITDLDTCKYRSDEIVDCVDIDSSFLSANYITYNDAVDIINEYQGNHQKKLTN